MPSFKRLLGLSHAEYKDLHISVGNVGRFGPHVSALQLIGIVTKMDRASSVKAWQTLRSQVDVKDGREDQLIDIPTALQVVMMLPGKTASEIRMRSSVHLILSQSREGTLEEERIEEIEDESQTTLLTNRLISELISEQTCAQVLGLKQTSKSKEDYSGKCRVWSANATVVTPALAKKDHPSIDVNQRSNTPHRLSCELRCNSMWILSRSESKVKKYWYYIFGRKNIEKEKTL
jgi:hypothetical protein